MVDFIRKLLKIEFFKFCVVGGLGVITDAGIYYILKRITNAQDNVLILNIIPLVGYFAAVFQNYLINHYWTFNTATSGKHINSKGFVTFFTVSLTSLLPRYLVYNLFLYIASSKSGIYPDIANLLGIIAGTIVNFLGSKFIVFKKKDENIS